MLSNVYGLYYNRRDDHENYYKSSLSYLAYTPADEMNEAEKKQLSVKMSMSILLGKNVFNISELLDKEVIQSLVGSDFEWLYKLIKSLGEGKIADFEKTFKDAGANIQKFPNIVKEASYLS
jgi:26S proteasome regulatory subunit N9